MILLLSPEIEIMAETATTTEDKKPVIASAGKVQRAHLFTQEKELPQQTDESTKAGEDAKAIADAEAAKAAKATETKAAESKTGEEKSGKEKTGNAPAEVDFTAEQKKAFFKQLGVDYNSDEDIETIKNKLKPADAEPSEEEKRKAEVAAEMRLLDLFVKNGGTPEQFSSIKNIANADPEEFSKKAVVMELVQNGISEEEAKAIATEMYYQNLLDNIEQDIDEEDKDFEARKNALQKKVDIGNKIIKAKSTSIQKNAADVIKGLKQALEEEELHSKNEATFLSNVDKTLTTLPRKQTFELGKVNDREIAPVLHEVSEDSIKQVAALLKDPAKRNQFFYNQDNTLNLTNLTPLLLNHFEIQRAVKGALLEGQTRQVAEFEKVFPASTGYELGIGAAATKANANGKGKIASSGKPERVNPKYN